MHELHLALQQYYARDDGLTEAIVDGFRVDVLRDGIIYEIQTRSLPAIRRKLESLAQRHHVVLVIPIAQTRRIVQIDPETGEERSARRSPKRGTVQDICRDLLYVREFLNCPYATLDVVLTSERELRRNDGRGSWRRKRVSLVGRELVEVIAVQRFSAPSDFARLLPAGLEEPFTVADVSRVGGMRPWLAGRLLYALRHLGTIELIGKAGNAHLYRRNANG